MKSQVVTLETAKKLKAAGLPQTTANYWLKQPKWAWRVGLDMYSASNRFAAPTAQEIADQLKDEYCCTMHMFDDTDDHLEWQDNMAEALAALYLKLQERK